MKKLLMVIPLVLLLCFTFGCQKREEVGEEPVVDIEADVNALKALVDEFDALENVGNPEGLVALIYAEDAVRMLPDEPMLRGKTAILERFKKGAEQFTSQIDNVVEDIQVDGNLAYIRGISTGSFSPKAGGEPITAVGKWMAVYKRQADGSWKCIADIYNRDNPLPTSQENQ